MAKSSRSLVAKCISLSRIILETQAIGRCFCDNTAPRPCAEASVVRSKGLLKSGYAKTTSSDARSVLSFSNDSNCLGDNSILIFLDWLALTFPFSPF